MAAHEISLGFPDSQTVTVFMDGKHVATMTNAPGYEDGIPVELFDLMRAAPDLLAALWRCRLRVLPSSYAIHLYPPDSAMAGLVRMVDEAINKAEGRVS